MQRPVSVFGILNIVFACFGILGTFASLSLLSGAAASNNPVAKIIQENATYMAYLKVMIPIGIFVSLILLVVGIGLLLLKNWLSHLHCHAAYFQVTMACYETVPFLPADSPRGAPVRPSGESGRSVRPHL